MIEVKLIGMDPKTGKLKLSHKALLPKPEGYEEPEKRERPRQVVDSLFLGSKDDL